ncbi:hypothetical protein U1Q18_046499 [Sarracenia purpurea var. burkii]
MAGIAYPPPQLSPPILLINRHCVSIVQISLPLSLPRSVLHLGEMASTGGCAVKSSGYGEEIEPRASFFFRHPNGGGAAGGEQKQSEQFDDISVRICWFDF